MRLPFTNLIYGVTLLKVTSIIETFNLLLMTTSARKWMRYKILSGRICFDLSSLGLRAHNSWSTHVTIHWVMQPSLIGVLNLTNTNKVVRRSEVKFIKKIHEQITTVLSTWKASLFWERTSHATQYADFQAQANQKVIQIWTMYVE